MTNRYEQCRSNPTRTSPQNPYTGPVMVTSKKRFLNRCCISVITRHD